MLLSVENRLHVQLAGLHLDEVAALAAALKAGPLDHEAVHRLYQGTGGHPLYLSTLLSAGFDFDPQARDGPLCPRRWPPPSLITSGCCHRRPRAPWRCSRC